MFERLSDAGIFVMVISYGNAGGMAQDQALLCAELTRQLAGATDGVVTGSRKVPVGIACIPSGSTVKGLASYVVVIVVIIMLSLGVLC